MAMDLVRKLVRKFYRRADDGGNFACLLVAELFVFGYVGVYEGGDGFAAGEAEHLFGGGVVGGEILSHK